MTLALGRMPRLLNEADAIVDVVARRSSSIAVAESGWALTAAAIADHLERPPMLIAVPTGTQAQRMVADLSTYFGDDSVELFPAWETLPFERVSPGVETMGQRMRVLSRLTATDRARRPKVIVAPIRALVQRLGPDLDRIEPIVVGVGDVIDSEALIGEPDRGWVDPVWPVW